MIGKKPKVNWKQSITMKILIKISKSTIDTKPIILNLKISMNNQKLEIRDRRVFKELRKK